MSSLPGVSPPASSASSGETLLAANTTFRLSGTLDWICVLKGCRHKGAAQKLLSTLRENLKAQHVDTLIALTAGNDEAQRFYKAVPDSEMRDIGIWIDINSGKKELPDFKIR